MALPELLDALRAQAAERRAEELRQATAAVERIRADARAEQARRTTEHVERAVRDANEAARRSLSESRSKAAESMLKARDRLLARVRSALEARARAATDDPDYRDGLPDELAGALERLPPGAVVVRARAELTGFLAAPAGNRPGVVLETVPDMGVGFVATCPECGVELDATLETKLMHRWPQIAVSVLAEVDS